MSIEKNLTTILRLQPDYLINQDQPVEEETAVDLESQEVVLEYLLGQVLQDQVWGPEVEVVVNQELRKKD